MWDCVFLMRVINYDAGAEFRRQLCRSVNMEQVLLLQSLLMLRVTGETQKVVLLRFCICQVPLFGEHPEVLTLRLIWLFG